MGCDWGVEVGEGWVEVLEEGGGGVEEDVLIWSGGVDLGGDVVEFGDVEDLVRGVGFDVVGVVVVVDLKVLGGVEVGEGLGVVVFGCFWGVLVDWWMMFMLERWYLLFLWWVKIIILWIVFVMVFFVNRFSIVLVVVVNILIVD